MTPRHWPARFHRAVYQTHLWLGLVSGLLLLLMSLTGAVLVFVEELEAVLYPHLLRVEPGPERASFDEMLATVRTAYPEATLYGFRMLPEEPGHSYTVNMKLEGRYWFTYVNPYDGTLLGGHDADQGNFTRTLLNLHFRLLSGKPGEVLIFLLGLTLVGAVLTGTWVYRKSLLRVFRGPVRWRAGTRVVAGELHHKVGVAALLFNLIIAISGAVMLWPSVSGLLRGSGAAPAPAPAVPELHASLDAMVARAPAELPGFVLKGLVLPLAPGGPVALYGYVPGGNPLLGTYNTRVEFEPDTGALRAVKDARAAPLLEKLRLMAGPVHFGHWGGLPIKLLYTLLGLSPGALSVTGFLMWWVKRRRKSPATVPEGRASAPHVPAAAP